MCVHITTGNLGNQISLEIKNICAKIGIVLQFSITMPFLHCLLRREHEMDAKIIVQMDGKKTRLLKPKQTTIDNNNVNASQSRDNFHDFTFDYSYWSFEDNVTTDRISEMEQQHVVTQDEVYNDLGMDVINCAFQGSYYFDIKQLQHVADIVTVWKLNDAGYHSYLLSGIESTQFLKNY